MLIGSLAVKPMKIQGTTENVSARKLKFIPKALNLIF